MNIYSIKMKKNLFFKYSDKIVASSVMVQDGYVFFKTDGITKKYLDENKINYSLSENGISKFKKKICQNLILILSVIIFGLVLYINTKRVSKISFNGEYAINEQIEEKIKKEYSHFLFWNFISSDFEELSKSLRASFSDYEWISAYKDGSTIYVVINNNEKASKIEQYGNIVAKKDAIIKSYLVYNGQAMIKENQYVKKGDVLISGQINNQFAEARGVILGTTFEEVELSVAKSNIELKETGNSYQYSLFSFFKSNFSIGKKNKYESYNTKKTLKFNLFDFFKIYKIEEHELCDIIEEYSFDTARDYAIAKITDDFNLNRHFEAEGLERIELLNHTEDNEKYTFKFLLKKVESIGEFQRY